MSVKLAMTKEYPILNFLQKQEFITRKDLLEIDKLLSEEDVFLEDALLRYLPRNKLLLVKCLFYGDKYGSIDLLELQDQLDEELVFLLTRNQMIEKRVMIVNADQKKIGIAMEEPTDNEVVKFVEKTTGLKVVEKYITLLDDIRRVLSQNRLMAHYLMKQGVIPEEDSEIIRGLLKDDIAEMEGVLLRYVNREELLQVKAHVNSNIYKYVDLFEIKDGLKDEFTNMLTREQILKYRALILYEKDKQLAVAMDDPCDMKAIKFIEKTTEGKITTKYITLFSDIEAILRYVEEKKAIKKREEEAEKLAQQRSEAQRRQHEKSDYELPMAFDIMDLTKFTLGGDSVGGVRPIIEAIIKQALVRGASDVHIEPTRDRIPKIRYRIDGILCTDNKIEEILEAAGEPKLTEKLISIIKVLSGESGKNMRLDVTDKPQDGRIYIPNVELDLRIIILPSFMGESAVIRILRRDMGELALDRLGFEQDTYERFKSIIELPYGMILVSGPTGAGKSTTQYAVLKLINSPEKKVLTIEDPVEYFIPGAVQNQVNPYAGFTFDVALRAFVRSDPNVIMVGEIRDVATASIAMESALTGHMVISSIHARDAISTVLRLQDMGVDTRLITATCTATLGQRLVRRICNHCRKPAQFSTKLFQAMEQHFIKYEPERLFRGSGCSKCYFTGYQGRVGLFELLEMTHDIKEMFLQEAPTSEIMKLARQQQGMRSLLEDALIKVAKGITTEEEVWRVTLLETEAWNKHEELGLR